MSNNGVPPLNDWQDDDYPVTYNEGISELSYIKTGNKNTINTGGSSYLVYVISVTQTGSGELTVAVTYENTIGTISINKVSPGYFTITSSGLFTLNKTWIPNTDSNGYASYPISSSAANAEFYTLKQVGADQIDLNFYNNSYSNTEPSVIFGDGFILNLPEIRVYP